MLHFDQTTTKWLMATYVIRCCMLVLYSCIPNDSESAWLSHACDWTDCAWCACGFTLLRVYLSPWHRRCHHTCQCSGELVLAITIVNDESVQTSVMSTPSVSHRTLTNPHGCTLCMCPCNVLFCSRLYGVCSFDTSLQSCRLHRSWGGLSNFADGCHTCLRAHSLR